VLSLTGNIVPMDDKPRLHAHVVISKADGTVHGGHFLEGRVSPTLEMIVSEMPVHLRCGRSCVCAGRNTKRSEKSGMRPSTPTCVQTAF
jgi:predicted DNA-binding protein with PD1-like motif